MPSVETSPKEDSANFRLDVPLNDLLMQPGSRTALHPAAEPEKLPDAVFYPELLWG